MESCKLKAVSKICIAGTLSVDILESMVWMSAQSRLSIQLLSGRIYVLPPVVPEALVYHHLTSIR